MPAWMPALPAWMTTEGLLSALSVLAIGAVTLLLWLLVRRASSRARRRFQEIQASLDLHSARAAAQRLTALQLLVNSARYLLFGSAILLILGRLNLIKSDSLLFPAGFLGAALGLGAQNLVRDVVAGVFIVFEGQFVVGDWVKINGVTGRIEEVGLRVTSLRDDTSQIHFFPNGAISTVARFPREAQALVLWVPLVPDEAKGVTPDKAAALVEEALKNFDLIYAAWHLPSERLEDENGFVRYALPVTPAQAAIVREKLPGRVSAALEAAGFKNDKGATVEITAAPVAPVGM